MADPQISIHTVPKKLLNDCWPLVHGHLTKAAEYTYGRYTAEDIYHMIANNPDVHLWAAADPDYRCYGAVVTGFTAYPKHTVLNLFFCGGDRLELWKDPMLAELRAYAKQVGCSCIELAGRRGWEKIFEPDGVKVRWTVCELPLE